MWILPETYWVSGVTEWPTHSEFSFVGLPVREYDLLNVVLFLSCLTSIQNYIRLFFSYNMSGVSQPIYVYNLGVFYCKDTMRKENAVQLAV